VLAQQNVYHLRDDLPGPSIELLIGEVGNGMGERQKLIVRHAPSLGHGPAGGLDHIGDDGRCWNAALLKQDAVEHTARAAGASVSHPGDHGVALRLDLPDDLLMRGYAGPTLAAQQHSSDAVLLL
jgi:hypothetical protein